jgi:hypothetical protein
MSEDKCAREAKTIANQRAVIQGQRERIDELEHELKELKEQIVNNEG